MKHILFILATILISISSCTISTNDGNRIKGNGNVVTIKKNISAFCKVSTSSSIDVEIVVDKNAATSCELIGEENVLNLIDINQQGDELEIKFEDNTSITYNKTLKVKLITNCLKKVITSGSGDITVNGSNLTEEFESISEGSGDIDIMNLKAAKAIVETSGSGDVTIEGKCTNATLNTNGSGTIDALQFICIDVTAATDGSGNIDVNAEKTLDAKTHGSGDINYTGDPVLRESVTGSGSVNKR
jgi:hypothetical protein